MTTVLWLVGPPGVGKTTLARKIIGQVQELVEKPKLTVAEFATAAGHYTGAVYDGADTVPYNGAAQVIDLWKQVFVTARPLFLLDGDRFSNANCKAMLAGEGIRQRCILLTGSEELLAQRRYIRGSTQDSAWMAGRATKANNFARTFPEGDLLTLDAEGKDLILKVREWLDAAS